MLVRVRQARTELLHYKHMLPSTKATWNQTMEENKYPCMVCLPTFTIKIQPNVGKYSSPMDPRDYKLHIRV